MSGQYTYAQGMMLAVEEDIAKNIRRGIYCVLAITLIVGTGCLLGWYVQPTQNIYYDGSPAQLTVVNYTLVYPKCEDQGYIVTCFRPILTLTVLNIKYCNMTLDVFTSPQAAHLEAQKYVKQFYIDGFILGGGVCKLTNKTIVNIPVEYGSLFIVGIISVSIFLVVIYCGRKSL